tara:strand:- start:249 stop:611 length:363 start_codon:yes stop_codon:yes gene_type:complete
VRRGAVGAGGAREGGVREGAKASIAHTDAHDGAAAGVEPLPRVLDERHVEEVQHLRPRQLHAFVEEARHADSRGDIHQPPRGMRQDHQRSHLVRVRVRVRVRVLMVRVRVRLLTLTLTSG